VIPRALAGQRRVDRHGRTRQVGVDQGLERRDETSEPEPAKHERQTIGVEERGTVHELEVEVRPGRLA
jgi:hypothetical protein